MNIKIAGLCTLATVIIGTVSYLVLPLIPSSNEISNPISGTSSLDSSNLLVGIETSLGSKPTSWLNNKVKAFEMAADLIQVCVDTPDQGEFASECDTFEYWTNNRSGKWELLGSFADGMEGWSSCSDWEELRVAKGMKCVRGSDYNSTVSF